MRDVSTWNTAHPENVRRNKANYRGTNREKLRKAAREFAQRLQKTNPERVRKPAREYGKRNKEVKRARLNAYRRTENGRLAHLESEARRRVQKMRGSLPVTIPVEMLQRLLDAYGRRCVYCGSDGPLTLDHFNPLARGGVHSVGNILPACKACNSSKHDADPFDWMEARGVDLDAVVAHICSTRTVEWN